MNIVKNTQIIILFLSLLVTSGFYRFFLVYCNVNIMYTSCVL